MDYGSDHDGYEPIDSGDAQFALKKANIYYAGVFLTIAIIGFIMVNIPNTWLTSCTNIEGSTKFQVGASFMYRMTAALCVWYLLHALIMIGNKNLVDSCQFMIHISYKFIHVAILVGLIVGSMWLPEKFTEVYFSISIVVSSVYLLFQLISLIDLFYQLNDKFVKDENFKLPIVLVSIFTIVTIGIFVACFFFFKCTEATVIICVNLICCLGLIAGGAFIERQSILTASMVTMYVGYLTFSGLMSDTSCSTLSSKSSGIFFEIFSCLFTLAWLVFSAFSLSGQVNLCSCSDDKFSLAFFHTIFAMAAPYLGMVVTNWGRAEEGQWKAGSGTYSKWAVIASSWASILLYVWTFVAPYIFPDREFD